MRIVKSGMDGMVGCVDYLPGALEKLKVGLRIPNTAFAHIRLQTSPGPCIRDVQLCSTQHERDQNNMQGAQQTAHLRT
jgi:hypothetical protein